jgi:uncharacterized protein
MDTPGDEIRQAEGEFFIDHEGKRVAELTYHRSGQDIVVTHTWVDPRRRGQGDAKRLVDAVVAYARAQKTRIVPLCSYVAKVTRGSQYSDVRK